MRPALQPQIEPKKDEFDIKVTHRHPRSGEIIHQDPYILRVIGGDHRKLYERPAGSGNLWDPRGKPAGRWNRKAEVGAEFEQSAQHIAWNAPETKDQKLAREYGEMRAENDALKKEMASLTSEKEKGRTRG